MMFIGEVVRKAVSNPNTLTVFRMAAAPGIVILLMVPNRFFTFVAAILFSLAAISDYLDGYLARRWGLISNFGKVMDPVADKLIVSFSFIMMVSLGWIPAWIICIIIGRELAITGLRSVVAEVESDADLSASWLGKYKTGFQIAAIIPLLFHYPYFGINLHAIGMFFLWGSLIFTVWSGVDYIIKFKHLLRT